MGISRTTYGGTGGNRRMPSSHLDISRGFGRVVQRCPFCVGMMLSARSEINMGCAWLLAGLNC